VVDRVFSEPKLAAVYDAFCAWEQRPELGFYLPLVMSADRVLDVGCGTGELLRLARERGHAGRLVGIDPAEAMLDVARVRSDVEWTLGDVHAAAGEFDLVVMTGNAFQVLLSDDEVRAFLRAVRELLARDGRFAFETRDPHAREWESWGTPREAGSVKMFRHVTKVDGDRVSFTLTFSSPEWDAPESSESTLRFHDVDALHALLHDAALDVVDQFVDDGEIYSVTRQRPSH
jgi:SAM-dependent methyltransferase